VRAEIEGIIKDIHVNEGDIIEKGALIAHLSDRDYQADIKKLNAQIAEKQANLKMLKAGPRRSEINLAKTEVSTAQTRRQHSWNRYQEAGRMRDRRLSKAKAAIEKTEERMKYAKSYFNMHRELFEKELISRRTFEESKEKLDVLEMELKESQAELKILMADDLAEVSEEFAVAEKELEEAKGRLSVLMAGSRPEAIEATQAEIARLNAEQNHLKEKLRLARIVSPITGIVTTPKLKEKLGQHVKEGDLIAEVYDLKTVTAEISVPEKEIGDVGIGQDVLLKVRAYPEKSFHGKVVSIAPTVTQEENRLFEKTIRVTTQLKNPGLLLKPDMTGNAKIYAGERRLIDIMTRRFTRYLRVEFWSWW